MNRRTLLQLVSLGGLSLVLLAQTGCKDEPKRTWAVETYPQHKAAVEQVRQELEPLFKQFAPQPYTKFDATKLQEQQDAQSARLKAFDEAALKALEAHPNLIGWELTYSFPDVEKPEIPYSFSKLSGHKPSHKGSTTVIAGSREVKADEKYPLGWGMYQVRGKEVRKSLGMEAPRYFKGIEILTTIKHEEALLKVRLFFVEPDLLKED